MTQYAGDWRGFLDTLPEFDELRQLMWTPDDRLLGSELQRQLLMNLSLGYFVYFQSDANHPDWTPFLNSVFLLQPNPDDTYYLAHVNGEGVYRISGERGGVHILTLTIGKGMMGMAEGSGAGHGEYDVDDLDINPDGTFEVIFSHERPAGYDGNWCRMERDTDYILLRQRSYHWGGEQDARLAIERLDVPVLKPRQSQAEIADRMQLLAAFTKRLSRLWLNYMKSAREKGDFNKFDIVEFSGGVKAQAYWQTVYELESDDQVLILESELPETSRYWNIQLNDPLFNTIEYVYRQSSLNGYQAHVDSDGRFRAVISSRDPGVPNWLDNNGYLRGTAIGRWYESSSKPIPTLKTVPFSELRNHLPADTPEISPREREESLRERIRGAQLRRRW